MRTVMPLRTCCHEYTPNRGAGLVRELTVQLRCPAWGRRSLFVVCAPCSNPAGHEKRWPAPQRIWFAWVGCLPQHAKITPGGTFTLLDSFDGTGGTGPGGLVQGNDGSFYGVTGGGGAYSDNRACLFNCGTIFKITPEGALTPILPALQFMRDRVRGCGCSRAPRRALPRDRRRPPTGGGFRKTKPAGPRFPGGARWPPAELHNDVPAG